VSRRGRAPAPSQPDDPSVPARPTTGSPAERWVALFGTKPPAQSRALIAAAVAWAEQVAASGDVAPAIQHDLAIVAHQVRVARLDRQQGDAVLDSAYGANGASGANSGEDGASGAICTNAGSCLTHRLAPEGEYEVPPARMPLASTTPAGLPHPRRRPARVAAPLPTASSQLTVGARLVKVHGGVTHVVDVTADGMRYDGRLFGSLSAVAKHITGTHWNGLLFFGLRRRKVHAGGARGHG